MTTSFIEGDRPVLSLQDSPEPTPNNNGYNKIKKVALGVLGAMGVLASAIGAGLLIRAVLRGPVSMILIARVLRLILMHQ